MAVVGIDVGGTFTDVVVAGEGRLDHFKVPTTPDDPAVAVLEALARVDDVERVAHGTTVATNALLTRTGARVALVTTEGFRDVLEIARQARPRLYEREVHRAPPLVPRHLRLEVDERVGPTGAVERELQHRTVVAVTEGLRAVGVDVVAVCLLHSYANRDHEDVVASHFRDTLGLPVVCSADVAPEFREFERTSTTVLSAYLGGVVDRYVGRLESEAGVPVDVMSSAGGLLSASAARRRAAALVLSGPAGGAQAAATVAGLSGHDGAIAFDVGGTSSDVCLIRDGVPDWTADHVVEGYPCRLPALAIHTVGAGGGSIAWVDGGGALRLGPASAGARPGPAAYGLGGTDATLTDANLVLGRLPTRFGALERPLDPDAARRALEPVAAAAGLSLAACARGIVEVAEVHVAGALRTVSVERGIDPAGLPLVAFGGAGPLHAASLAARIGAPFAVVPARAGVLSALGLLLTPPRRDAVVTVLASLDDEHVLEHAARQAAAEARMEWGSSDADYELWAECRYRGQSHELAVPVPAPEAPVADVRASFDREHRRRNGYDRPDAEVELVAVRAVIQGAAALDRAELPRWPERSPTEPIGRRDVDWGGDQRPTAIHHRTDLGAGTSIDGPAVVEDDDTTVAVPPGVRADVDEFGSLLLRWT